MKMSRRDVLKLTAAAPLLHLHSSFMSWLPQGNNRCLLVLELQGGNDGLNTVIPVHESRWRQARPSLSRVFGAAMKLQDGLALHPAMSGMHKLIQAGQCNVVQGVGYPGMDRSHFRSRDIWHTADPQYLVRRADTTGWLGRAVDLLAQQGAAVPGLSVGSLQVPLALQGKQTVVPSLHRLEDYELLVAPGPQHLTARKEEIQALLKSDKEGKSTDLRSFLQDVATSSMQQAQRLQTELQNYQAKASYPETELGRKLQLAARVMVSGFGTRIFHVGFSGFDTHASQLGTHEALLRQLSESLSAIVGDLQGHGHLDQVLVMVHSEFGRRLAENQSKGTDHGAAGPVFFLGGKIKPGLLNAHPSLQDLDQGDLHWSCDFRELYAAALGWLGVEAKAVLGEVPFRKDRVNPLV